MSSGGWLQRPRKVNQSDRLRQSVWVLHFGPHAKTATCPLCGLKAVRQEDKGSWESGHIVSESFCMSPESPYFRVPICAACNKVMGTRCMIDYCWEIYRVDALKQICLNIYTAYAQEHPDEMPLYDWSIWRLIAHLFGSESHQAGGGITVANEWPIYRMLMLFQIKTLEAEIGDLIKTVSEKSTRIQTLLQDAYKPEKHMKRPFA